jgi:hypothetical protein
MEADRDQFVPKAFLDGHLRPGLAHPIVEARLIF